MCQVLPFWMSNKSPKPPNTPAEVGSGYLLTAASVGKELYGETQTGDRDDAAATNSTTAERRPERLLMDTDHHQPTAIIWTY